MPIDGFTNGPDLTASCLGYAVLAGLHGKTAGDANFIEQKIDRDGNPVVTIRIEYNKPYTAEIEGKK